MFKSCYQCPFRSPTCHVSCRAYNEEAAARQEKLAAKKAEADVNMYEFYRHEKLQKRAKTHHHLKKKRL